MQFDFAKNIQEIMRILQLQGNVELAVQPLTNEHKGKIFVESTDLAEEVKPQETQTQDEIKEPLPKGNPRKDDASRQIPKDSADKAKDITLRSPSPRDAKQKDRQTQRSRSPKWQKTKLKKPPPKPLPG